MQLRKASLKEPTGSTALQRADQERQKRAGMSFISDNCIAVFSIHCRNEKIKELSQGYFKKCSFFNCIANLWCTSSVTSETLSVKGEHVKVN